MLLKQKKHLPQHRKILLEAALQCGLNKTYERSKYWDIFLLTREFLFSFISKLFVYKFVAQHKLATHATVRQRDDIR